MKLNLSMLAGIAIIVLIAFIAYIPSISGGFIWDDDLLITNNSLIRASDGLYPIWCTTVPIDYWPVLNTTFWIEWRLWGKNPTGYHVVNLILHVLDALLIWLILRKLSIPGAFLAAVIFAVHPVNVESVAWIAQRKNMMAMFFFLLSILWYLKIEILSPRASSPLPLWYWLSLAAFILAMLSKGSVAVLPVLLLGILWWLRSLTRRDMLRIAPLFLLSVVLTVVNTWFQTHGEPIEIRNAGFAERLLGAGGVLWFYLYKALLPFDLAFIYPPWHVEVGDLLWWLPLLAALIITAVLWRYRNGWSRPLLFAWGFFCVAIAPVMGISDVYFMKYSLVADHYQHIAIIGVIALAAAGWSLWHKPMRGATYWAASAITVVAAGTLAFLTWQQSGLYRDEITLYRDTLQKSPDCWLAHNNLGYILDNMGQSQEAIEHYLQALRLKPDYYQAQFNLGNAFAQTGRLQEAIEHYQQALRLNPKDANALNNLGSAFVKAGRLQEAIEHYQQAIRLKPDYADAHFNLGLALFDAGRLQEAIEHYQQALRLNPDDVVAHNNLSGALIKAGRPKEAIEHYQQALRLRPGDAYLYLNLALTYAVTNQSSQAIAAAQKGLQLARSQGQQAQAEQIEMWLNSYRAGPPGAKNAPAAPGAASSLKK